MSPLTHASIDAARPLGRHWDHPPAIYATPAFVSAGGLISYGSDPIADYRRAGDYVNRILKGLVLC